MSVRVGALTPQQQASASVNGDVANGDVQQTSVDDGGWLGHLTAVVNCLYARLVAEKEHLMELIKGK